MTATGEFEQTLAAALAERRADGLYRRRQVVQSVDGPRIVVDGRSLLAFCSNDYLGLRDHPDLAAAAARAAETFGTGAGAAHLISGHTAEHHALEEELAEFVGRPRALLFSTGYMANLGIASALLRRGDAVFEDRLNHASLLDAGLLSGARFRRYPHLDIATLDRRLRDAAGARRRLVMTDAVFSMDGDRAPLGAMARVCTETGSILAVDDAHGFGVLGRDGRGSLHVPGEGSDPEAAPIYMATLGKAAGVAGAFVAGSESLVETLIQEARTYIYTTAMPAPVAAATRAALELVRAEGWRREHLGALVARFRQGARELGLKLCGSDTAIQPLILGETAVATAAAAALLERGLLVPAIRPPTVPEGSARLRVTLSASHEEVDVDRLLEALEVAV